MSRSWLTVAVVACCLAPVAATAVQFKVLNCTDKRIEAWAYNDTDLLRAIPYKVTSIESRMEGTVECATASCSTIFHPAGAPGLSYPSNPSYDFCLVYFAGTIQMMSWTHRFCLPEFCGTIQP